MWPPIVQSLEPLAAARNRALTERAAKPWFPSHRDRSRLGVLTSIKANKRRSVPKIDHTVLGGVSRQPGSRNRVVAVVPANQQQHVVGTRILRREVSDVGRFSFAKRSHYFGSYAPSRERKPDFVLQVVISAESLLFWSIRVDDDVHCGFVLRQCGSL